MNRETAIRNLIEALDDYLSGFGGAGIAEVRAGVARYKSGPLREKAAQRIGAVAHVEKALDWMRLNGAEALSHAIETAMPYLYWAAYDPYPRDVVGETYATNHAATSLIGKFGIIPAEDFDFGLFGFGPNILYRDHRHAAPELYAPFTGPNGWRFSSGEALKWEPANKPVWNPSLRQHAIRSGNQPFPCVYGWTRDVAIPAEMIIEPDWPQLEAEPAPDHKG